MSAGQAMLGNSQLEFVGGLLDGWKLQQQPYEMPETASWLGLASGGESITKLSPCRSLSIVKTIYKT